MDEKFKNDYLRTTGCDWSNFQVFIKLFKNHSIRYEFYGRKAVSARFEISKRFYRLLQKLCGTKYGLEMDFLNIEAGLVLMHPFDITINPNAIVGKNVTLFKGATIGSIRSGKKAGTPIIGDRVTICCNAFVCGNIHIGNNVLIAANAYVNFDVPDNSVVIGNPGMIKQYKNPSADYL